MTKASQTPPRPERQRRDGGELFSAALAASLRLQRERQRLGRLAADAGVDLLFLKAAWAEPVLYGDSGARLGSDIDVLIDPAGRDRFAAALRAAGYRRDPKGRDPIDLAEPKAEGWRAPEDDFPVDVHWALANPPWFELPARPLLDRCRDYDSAAGPIRSLAVEDHVVHAAAHSASQSLDLDDRHFEDVRRLSERHPIDWAVVLERARAANVDLALVHLGRWLRHRGVQVPARLLDIGPTARARLSLAGVLSRAFSGRRPWIGARLVGVATLARREADLGRLLWRWGRVRVAELRRDR